MGPGSPGSISPAPRSVLANNAITGNGTAAGATGGRFGVTREGSSTPIPAGIRLLNNLLCGNRLGEITGPALDATDAGNLTPTGAEGPGVSASPGCEVTANVYANVAGADGLLNTRDDDFTLAEASPAIDRGMDPGTLGLSPVFNPLLVADFAAEAARPQVGTLNGSPLFDMGAREFVLPDTQAPTVTFLQPQAGAFVRQAVTVEARATDDSEVASLALNADAQVLTTSLNPAPPAPTVTGTAVWNTLPFADGTHTLTATATDTADNSASPSATRVVIVDNTPPETRIDAGSTGEIGETSATFTFSGEDNFTGTGIGVCGVKCIKKKVDAQENAGAVSPGNAVTICCAAQAAVGCSVTFT